MDLNYARPRSEIIYIYIFPASECASEVDANNKRIQHGSGPGYQFINNCRQICAAEETSLNISEIVAKDG